MVPIPDRGKPGVLSMACKALGRHPSPLPQCIPATPHCFSHVSDVRHVSASGPLHVLFTLPGALNLSVLLLLVYPSAWLTAGAQ